MHVDRWRMASEGLLTLATWLTGGRVCGSVSRLGAGSGKLSPGPSRLPVPLLLHLVSHCIVNSLLTVARRLL